MLYSLPPHAVMLFHFIQSAICTSCLHPLTSLSFLSHWNEALPDCKSSRWRHQWPPWGQYSARFHALSPQFLSSRWHWWLLPLCASSLSSSPFLWACKLCVPKGSILCSFLTSFRPPLQHSLEPHFQVPLCSQTLFPQLPQHCMIKACSPFPQRGQDQLSVPMDLHLLSPSKPIPAPAGPLVFPKLASNTITCPEAQVNTSSRVLTPSLLFQLPNHVYCLCQASLMSVFLPLYLLWCCPSNSEPGVPGRISHALSRLWTSFLT